VPDFLIKGAVTLLSGDPKAGKSTIAKNLAYSVATGKPFLGREVEQGFVYYVQIDDSPSWTLDTLVLLNNGQDIDDIQVTPRLLGIEPNQYVKYLQAVVTKFPQVKLIVLDTVSKFLPLDNINDYKPVEIGINNIANFAHDTGVSLLLIHHAAKDDSRGDIKAHMGSQAFSAGVDIPLIARKRGTNQGSITGHGRRTREIEVHYDFNPDTHRVLIRKDEPVVGPAAQRANATTARKEAIVAHLRERSGESTQSGIFEDNSIKGDKSTKRETLQAMVTEGTITVTEQPGKSSLVRFVVSWDKEAAA
jgi:hypothetical protein